MSQQFSENHAKAAQIMLSDILEKVLAHAENPGWLATYLTRQIRELIGGKIVVLAQCCHHQTPQHRLVSVCPERHTALVTTPVFEQLAKLSHQLSAPTIVSQEDGAPEIRKIFQDAGWGVSMLVPLNIGDTRFGLLCILDFLSTHRIEDVLQTLEILPNIVALVLKDSLMYEHLEQIVAERTAEICRLNKELEYRIAQRTAQLEAANRELQSFAYVVSHDLKAPLRGISQLTHWIVNDYASAFDEYGREMADLLLGRVKRMDNLIEGILSYSRVGRITGQQERIPLNTLLPMIVDSLSPPPSIQIHIAPDFPAIVGDAIRIQQVFANLIGNAMKHMDKPSGEIRAQWEDGGAEWRFSVSDNGPGIDAKYHDKIFQIFQTLHPRDEVESTGIGLAIVKKIVEFYGGNIWVESVVGQGSTFYFTWPKVMTGATIWTSDLQS